jgi:pimeloyl-ACP methyl ester carboxylesterase
MKRLRVVVVLASLWFAVLTPAAPTVAGARASSEPRAAALAVPVIDWHPCKQRTRFDCARVPVPLDYDDPLGPTIALAITRLPAADPAQRLGSIFTNPGGPGGSGVDFIHAAGRFLFSDEVRERFDIIGFDPRGVARSEPIECFETFEEFQPVIDLAPFWFPVTRAEERGWIESDAFLNDACATTASPIIDHMSTANVARDLDLLRQAVGDEMMTYYGVSYGSHIGSTYANMFPDRVRAVAIDGIIDPVSYTTGRGNEAETLPADARLKSEQGAYATLLAFFHDCKAGGPNCAFSNGSPRHRYDSLATRLRRHPIELHGRGGGTFPFGYDRLVVRTLSAMYSPYVWPRFARFLQRIYVVAGEPRRVRARQGPGAPRGDRRRTPYEQTFEGFLGVWCSDSDNPDDPSAWATSARAADEAFAYFGRPWIWGSSACASWPGADDDRYVGPFDVPTANDVLIIGNRNDPATRYQAAESTHLIMPRSRLITLEGSGHTSLFLSRCVDGYLNAYLLTGAVPSEDAVCQVDVVPFAEPSPRSAAARAAAPFLDPPTVRPAR